MLQDIRQDVSVALRSAARRPGLSVTAALCLAVGIGANAAVYGAFDFFVLRPLPVEEPHRLVRVLHRPAGSPDPLDRELSFPEVRQLRRASRLEGVAVFEGLAATLRAGDRLEPVVGQLVSGDFFAVLGVPMQIGRGFGAAPGVLGEPGIAVLSDSLWRRAFGADPGILGRTLFLDEHAFEVAGVAPPGFRGVGLGVDHGVFVPLASRTRLEGGGDWEQAPDAAFQVLARLAPGAGVETARAEIQGLLDDLRGPGDRPREVAVLPERAGLIAPDAPGLLDAATGVALGGMGLVLLVACANVGGLLLARAVSRRREIAVRLAVGASRWRLARLLFAESAVLAAPATAGGLLLAHWASGAWTAFMPPLPIPLVLDVAPDASAAAYAAFLGVGTALLASALPLRQALRRDVLPALKGEAGASPASSGRRLLDGVAVAQLAFSAAVLGVAGLFLATLRGAQSVDPGFEHERTLAARLDLPAERYAGAEAARLQRELRQRVSALPGVRPAALGSSAPLTGIEETEVRLPGADPASAREVLFGVSSPGFFGALGVRLVEGRDFEEEEPRPVAIVGRTLARELWPGASAIGKHLEVGGEESPVEVVGVAEDYKYVALLDPDRAFLHLPLSRHPRQRLWLTLATEGDPAASAPALRSVLAQLDPQLQPALLTGAQLVAADLWLPRTAALLAGAAGLTVLALAAVGVLGAMSFAVARRRRELGIRMALGASQRAISGLVLSHALRLVGAGGALGLVGALAIARGASGLLFGVAPWEPRVYAAALVILAAAALGAAWLPTRRATALVPASALRTE